MIVESIFPFIAICFFLLALVIRHRAVSDRRVAQTAGALGWLSFAVYCIGEVLYYFIQGEYYDTFLAVLFLGFSILMAALMLSLRSSEPHGGDAGLLFSITRIATICALLYFPFSEVAQLGTLLIYLTTKITVAVLALSNGGVYMVYPAEIYTTHAAFHEIYKPIEIILPCTAIESMVLFTGLIFGVPAPIDRKVRAFFVSVPLIYLLNIVRNVFVTAAYFGAWFGPPLQSFYVAHGIIARIFVMVSLLAIAYAVLMILPEALDVIEDFFRVLLRRRRITSP